jgi:hypothetical protein
MHLLVDCVDLFAELLQRGRSGGRLRHTKNPMELESLNC